MKKLVIGLACLLVAGLSGVITYFAIPKDKPIDLKVEVSDIIVEVGEYANINWSVNLDEALVTFETSDNSKATYKHVSGKDCVLGVAIGEALIKVNAKYNGVKASDSAKITVIAKDGSDSPNDPEENTPPSDDGGDTSTNPPEGGGQTPDGENGSEEPTTPPADTPDGGEGDGSDDPDKDDDGTDETPEATINIFDTMIYCSLEENKIILDSGASIGLVHISLGNIGIESIDIDHYDTSKMTIMLNPELGNNHYDIFVNSVGEHSWSIFLNGVEYKYVVVKN